MTWGGVGGGGNAGRRVSAVARLGLPPAQSSKNFLTKLATFRLVSSPHP